MTRRPGASIRSWRSAGRVAGRAQAPSCRHPRHRDCGRVVVARPTARPGGWVIWKKCVNLEFPDIFWGRWQGRKVVYCCAYGAPRTVEIIHLFGLLGAQLAVQIGTCGGLQPHLRTGDIILPTTALCRGGGAVLRRAGKHHGRPAWWRRRRIGSPSGVTPPTPARTSPGHRSSPKTPPWCKAGMKPAISEWTWRRRRRWP